MVIKIIDDDYQTGIRRRHCDNKIKYTFICVVALSNESFFLCRQKQGRWTIFSIYNEFDYVYYSIDICNVYYFHSKYMLLHAAYYNLLAVSVVLIGWPYGIISVRWTGMSLSSLVRVIRPITFVTSNRFPN